MTSNNNPSPKHTFWIALAFTGVDSSGNPTYHQLDGKGWKVGGAEVNPHLPKDWYVLTEPQLFELPVPDNFDPMALALKGIDAEVTEVRANFEKRMTELTRKRNDLLMIGHEVQGEVIIPHRADF